MAYAQAVCDDDHVFEEALPPDLIRLQQDLDAALSSYEQATQRLPLGPNILAGVHVDPAARQSAADAYQRLLDAVLAKTRHPWWATVEGKRHDADRALIAAARSSGE